MTATTIPRPAAKRAALAIGRPSEATVFRAALAVTLLHALDDAFPHRGAGVPLGQHVFGAVVTLLLGGAAAYLFPTLRPIARAAVALFAGGVAVVNGAMHLKHIDLSGASGGDFTGVLSFAAGVVLAVLAVAVLYRHRGEGAVSRRRRWTYRVVAVPLGLLAFVYTIVPVGTAITETHKWRTPIGDPPSADYREVSFDASDGVKITGWYKPTENGATMLVLHGGGGDRTGAVRHAKLLAKHGYGVLLHDARGRGESEGVQNSWGWGWDKDVAGAMAFLKRRPEVDPERIGGLGLSTGADVLANAAAERTDLKAVVADGTAAGNFEDTHNGENLGMTPFYAVEFATVRLVSGSTPGANLEDSMKRIRNPLLLIAAGPLEEPFARNYDRAAGDRPVDAWYLPEVQHTHGLREVPQQYEARVTAFLGAELLAD
jgi:dienelactone hydrolase